MTDIISFGADYHTAPLSVYTVVGLVQITCVSECRLQSLASRPFYVKQAAKVGQITRILYTRPRPSSERPALNLHHSGYKRHTALPPYKLANFATPVRQEHSAATYSHQEARIYTNNYVGASRTRSPNFVKRQLRSKIWQNSNINWKFETANINSSKKRELTIWCTL
jgi:hypothetical protein